MRFNYKGPSTNKVVIKFGFSNHGRHLHEWRWYFLVLFLPPSRLGCLHDLRMTPHLNLTHSCCRYQQQWSTDSANPCDPLGHESAESAVPTSAHSGQSSTGSGVLRYCTTIGNFRKRTRKLKVHNYLRHTTTVRVWKSDNVLNLTFKTPFTKKV